MNPTEHELIAHVRLLDRQAGNLKRRGFAYRNYYDFLAREGAFFAPADCSLRLAPRQCFFNALLLAIVRGFPYVEGMGIGPHGGPPHHHAWNLDGVGRVIDPTWQRGRGYLGVQFSAERANIATWDRDASVLQDPTHALLRDLWVPEPSPGHVGDLLRKIASDALSDPETAPGFAEHGVTDVDALVDLYYRMAVAA